MLKILAVIIVVLIVLAVLATTAKNKGKSNSAKKDYDYKKRQLLTNNEKKVYQQLIDALPGYLVFTQVELSRCIEAEGPSHLTISGKSLDFVICNKDFDVVAGIEIDDKSHTKTKRTKADARKNNAMEVAGIKLIRWPATPLPSIAKIQEAFPAITEPTTEKAAIQSTQDKKIKILEQQLFNMARKLEKSEN
ncbi:DUF2726 domain-containing protein [Collimonas antrihumi]|uniref:DUF2726 domain-containing protein n=1 Tax=Collimonas antrihumi TaxID=1940615 RepID=UPI001B8C728F|nr:DUF2726 domain-containing protein [Collimonas antrihumi]